MFGIPIAAAEKSLSSMLEAIPDCLHILRKSFVSAELQEEYEALITMRAERLS
jgi:hypothetical protein